MSVVKSTASVVLPILLSLMLFLTGCAPSDGVSPGTAAVVPDAAEQVQAVAPGKSIGGDYFGNYEGILPQAKGLKYYEADCYYTGGKRRAERIVFSNDGHVYYTEDHYTTFTELFPSSSKEGSQ